MSWLADLWYGSRLFNWWDNRQFEVGCKALAERIHEERVRRAVRLKEAYRADTN